MAKQTLADKLPEVEAAQLAETQLARSKFVEEQEKQFLAGRKQLFETIKSIVGCMNSRTVFNAFVQNPQEAIYIDLGISDIAIQKQAGMVYRSQYGSDSEPSVYFKFTTSPQSGFGQTRDMSHWIYFSKNRLETFITEVEASDIFTRARENLRQEGFDIDLVYAYLDHKMRNAWKEYPPMLFKVYPDGLFMRIKPYENPKPSAQIKSGYEGALRTGIVGQYLRAFANQFKRKKPNSTKPERMPMVEMTYIMKSFCTPEALNIDNPKAGLSVVESKPRPS